MIDLGEEGRIEEEVTYTEWPNYVMLRQNLVQDIGTGPDDERQASWQWEVDSTWIRLS